MNFLKKPNLKNLVIIKSVSKIKLVIMTNPKFKFIIPSIIGIIVCFAIGITAKFIQTPSLETWYPLLEKSSLTPPNIVFPIAWGIIYLLTGASIGFIWNSTSAFRGSAIVLFITQLFLNFFWSITFFYMQSPVLGFINIVLLDIAVIMYMSRCRYINRIAYWLNIPYIVWLCLATYLNGYIILFY